MDFVRLETLRLRNKRMIENQKNVPLHTVLEGRTFYGGEEHHKTFRGDGCCNGGVAIFGGAKNYRELGKHLAEIKGSGFWSDFADGFKSVIKPVANVVSTVGHLIPHPLAQGLATGADITKGVLGDGKKQDEKDKEDEKLAMEVKGEKDKEGSGFLDDALTFAVGGPVGVMAKKALGFGKKQDEQDKEDEKLAMEIKEIKDKSKKGKGKKKMSDKMRRRSALVKKIMKEKGLKMIEASKYIKKHNLKY